MMKRVNNERQFYALYYKLSERHRILGFLIDTALTNNI
jgi:hypothetical protein